MSNHNLLDADAAYLKKHLPGYDATKPGWCITSGPIPTDDCEYRYEVVYGVNCGSCGELIMRWREEYGHLVPQMVAFDEGFKLLDSPFHRALIRKLAAKENFTPEDFIRQLIALGGRFWQ